MHPQAAGLFHYHSASPCIADPDYLTNGPSGDIDDVMDATKIVYR